jgi:hypothetical protein
MMLSLIQKHEEFMLPTEKSPQLYEWLIRQIFRMDTKIYIKGILPARRRHVNLLTSNVIEKTTKRPKPSGPIT